MAFEKEDFGKLDVGLSGVSAIWGYSSTVDDITVIETLAYFNEVFAEVSIGDLIYILPSTSGAGFFKVVKPGTDVIITELYSNTVPTQNLANMRLTIPGTTVVTALNTYEKMTVSTIFDPVSNNFSSPTFNQLRFDGTTTSEFMVVFNASMVRTNPGTDLFTIAIFKNGTLVVNSEMPVNLDNISILSVGTNSILTLSGGDFIEIFIKNDNSINNADLRTMTVSIIGLS